MYSNRSLCNLQINLATDAYSDATSSTCYDPTYLKGFWRLGQACVKLKRNGEALVAYESALELEVTNKALKKEVEKVKNLVAVEEMEMKKKIEQGVDVENKESTKVIKKSALNNAQSKSSSSTVKHRGKEKVTENNANFSKSDHVRGYKIVDGKKTSFFHHEQTEEEKRLIGDIAPKKIDSANVEDNLSTNGKGTSVWNKAGTWEEKDCTKWALSSIKEKLMETKYSLPSSSPDPNATVRVVDVSKLDPAPKGSAHASVATVRGKKRYIYEFSICIHWEMKFSNDKTCTGTLTFPDVDGTHEIGQGYDVSAFILSSQAPTGTKCILERFVRDDGLRGALEKKLDEWVELFRKTY